VRVLATRDDGARLVGDNSLVCGLLESEDGAVILPIASITSRGNWEWSPAFIDSVALRPGTEDAIRQASAEFAGNHRI
jgi:hypothetical protein